MELTVKKIWGQTESISTIPALICELLFKLSCDYKRPVEFPQKWFGNFELIWLMFPNTHHKKIPVKKKNNLS